MPIASLRSRALVGLAVIAAGLAGCATEDTSVSFSLSVSPSPVTIQQGGSGTVTVSQSGTYDGQVLLGVSGLPAGVNPSFSPLKTSSNQSSTLTLDVASDAVPGQYQITVNGDPDDPNVGTQGVNFTLTIAPAPLGSIALATNPASITVEQGAAGTSGVTLTRTAPFAGPVDLTATTPQAGIGVTFNPGTIAAGSTTAGINVTVASTVPTGPHVVTITGNANTTGISNATTTLTVNVTAPPTGGFTVALNPTALTVTQGASGTSNVTITRTAPFAGDVALALVNPPTGITGTFNPTPVPGGSTASVLTLNVAGTVAPGPYAVTVRGTGGTLPAQDVTLNLTVQQANQGTTVVVDFSCDPIKPIAFWGQDGKNAAWVQVAPGANNTFSFIATQTDVGVSWVMPQTVANRFDWSTYYATRDQQIAAGTARCATPPNASTYTGTVTGFQATEQAQVSIGGAATIDLGPGPKPFTVTTAAANAQILIGTRSLFGALGLDPNRMFILRTFTSGGTADFNGAEGFDPASSMLTIGNLGADNATAAVSYDAGSTTASVFFDLPGNTTTRTIKSVPLAKQNAGELHTVFVFGGNAGFTSTRSIGIYKKDLSAGLTATLGDALVGSIDDGPPGPYATPSCAMTATAQYNRVGTCNFSQLPSNGNEMNLSATSEWFGATTAWELHTPTLPGFNSAWGLLPLTQVEADVSIQGYNGTGQPVDGTTIYLGSLRFQFTP